MVVQYSMFLLRPTIEPDSLSLNVLAAINPMKNWPKLILNKNSKIQIENGINNVWWCSLEKLVSTFCFHLHLKSDGSRDKMVCSQCFSRSLLPLRFYLKIWRKRKKKKILQKLKSILPFKQFIWVEPIQNSHSLRSHINLTYTSR